MESRACQICNGDFVSKEVFGDAENAREWLIHPQRGLGNVVPVELAKSEIGAREVENLLGRIEYGVYS